MTTTEIKSELIKARDAERAYRLARDKYIAYQQLIIGGKSVRYDDTGGTHEKNGNSVERAYCCLADYAEEAEKLMQEMIAARQRAEVLIASVPDAVQREVLTRRYIIGQRWESIAIDMDYEVRHIYRLHGNALSVLSNMSLNVSI